MIICSKVSTTFELQIVMAAFLSRTAKQSDIVTRHRTPKLRNSILIVVLI